VARLKGLRVRTVSQGISEAIGWVGLSNSAQFHSNYVRTVYCIISGYSQRFEENREFFTPHVFNVTTEGFCPEFIAIIGVRKLA